MPDIGLLQGPPRPKLVPVAMTPVEQSIAALPAEPPAPADLLDAVADEVEAIKVAAHTGVVSDAPLAVLREPAVAVAVPTLAPMPAPMPTPGPAATYPDAAAAHTSSQAQPDAVATPGIHVPDPPASAKQPLQSLVPPPIRLSDLLWLLLALVVIIGTGLGVRDPWPADEPRFASLARDMTYTGEWLFPRVGGDLYQDKPPLFFWLLAVCYTLFGSFKGWFLIPSFLAAAGILFMVYDMGRRTVSREAGLAAAILLLCTVQFVQTTRGAQIDSTLCLLTTFSVYALLRHFVLGDGWRWYLAAGFAAGLGVITKGVGFLPLLLLIP